jgi:hypothetical protein
MLALHENVENEKRRRMKHETAAAKGAIYVSACRNRGVLRGKKRRQPATIAGPATAWLETWLFVGRQLTCQESILLGETDQQCVSSGTETMNPLSLF